MKPYPFLNGLLTMGYLVVALFFLRYHRRTRLTLFKLFAIAFAVLALQPALSGIFDLDAAGESRFFAIRFVGFLIIIFALVRESRSSTGQ